MVALSALSVTCAAAGPAEPTGRVPDDCGVSAVAACPRRSPTAARRAGVPTRGWTTD